MPTNPDIPEDQVELDKGYYHCVYVILHFKKEVGVDSRKEQADVVYNPDKEEMEDLKLHDEKESHWRMVFEDNG